MRPVTIQVITAKTFSVLLGKYSTPVYRLIVSAIFIFAGIAKVGHISSLIWEIEQYQILPDLLTKIFGYVLPYSEIAIGLLLLVGIWLRFSASIAGLLTLSFTIAKVSAWLRGISIDICPCFGPFIPLLTIYSLVIDIVILLLVMLIIIKPNITLTLRQFISK
jgi:uncharacterized membrane protein YphA (DoxX/SURF4 family)